MWYLIVSIPDLCTLTYFCKKKHQNQKCKSKRDCIQHTCAPSAGICCPHLGPSYKTKIFQLEKVQHRAARWTTSNYNYRSSVAAMLQSLGWQTLEQRQTDARLCLFYKIVYGLVTVPLPVYIQQTNRLSRHCHSMTFTQIYTSKDFYKYSFYPLTIVKWNALPQHVACLPTNDFFKEAVGRLQHSKP